MNRFRSRAALALVTSLWATLAWSQAPGAEESAKLNFPEKYVGKLAIKVDKNYEGKPCYRYDIEVTSLEICGASLLQGAKVLGHSLLPLGFKYEGHECFEWSSSAKYPIRVCGPFVFSGVQSYFEVESSEYLSGDRARLPQGDHRVMREYLRRQLDSAMLKSAEPCTDCSSPAKSDSTKELIGLIQGLDRAVQALAFRVSVEDLEGLAAYEYRLRTSEAFLKSLAHTGVDRHGLTADEIVAIKIYAMTGYMPVNSALRRKDRAEIEKYQPYIDKLNSALEKLPPFVGMVNRGADLPTGILAQHQPGAVVTYDAYTSTSTDLGFPASHRFAIQSYSGRYIGKHGGLGNEEEVLFKPGTKFKVLSRQKISGGTIQFVMKEMTSEEIQAYEEERSK